ncbi:MAG: N-acetylneuraminate synthase [Candidatus Aenigmatarchaeota archaeon]|nr:MAG: N-acetylneuraminate synthase [Candidatus Aenigmarchaeota archaeon]
MGKTINIGNKVVGGDDVLIIAEIGINHNGDVKIAKKLISVAAECGCDAVKFQKKTPNICVPDDQKNKPKDTPWGEMTYLEYKKRMELSEEDFTEIDRYCKEKGILWFASCWDVPSVDFIEKFNPPCYKVASASITDMELLNRIKATGKPAIVSTGMSTMEEIRNAVNTLGEDNIVLLHCNSSYPAKNEELNLAMIETLGKEFSCPVGYSGHETGVFPSVMAAVLGAKVIERHITLDRAMWGTDHAASLEPQGLSRLVRDIRLIKVIKGDGIKKVYPSEFEIKKKLRRADGNEKADSCDNTC